jgi:hypothetical protein
MLTQMMAGNRPMNLLQTAPNDLSSFGKLSSTLMAGTTLMLLGLEVNTEGFSSFVE